MDMRRAAAGCVAAGLLVGAAGCGAAAPRSVVALATAEAPSPTPTPAAETVRFNGVVVTLPEGWRSEPLPFCSGPEDRTVAIQHLEDDGASCSALAVRTGPKPSFIELSPFYGQDFALTWDGSRTVFQGQPAWRTPTSLALPWSNVLVRASSADLLQQVSVAPAGGLLVPSAATSIRLESFRADEKALAADVTRPADVAALLDDLRGLLVTTSAVTACGPKFDILRTVILTVAGRTYEAQFDDCGQVMGGTGVGAAVDAALRDDVRRLLPGVGF